MKEHCQKFTYFPLFQSRNSPKNVRKTDLIKIHIQTGPPLSDNPVFFRTVYGWSLFSFVPFENCQNRSACSHACKNYKSDQQRYVKIISCLNRSAFVRFLCIRFLIRIYRLLILWRICFHRYGYVCRLSAVCYCYFLRIRCQFCIKTRIGNC